MKVAVIGAGIMGSGIAQLAASAGHDVAVRDVSHERAAPARTPRSAPASPGW